jgi:hypothetical protein
MKNVYFCMIYTNYFLFKLGLIKLIKILIFLQKKKMHNFFNENPL